MTTLGPCVYCPRPAKEAHHFTAALAGHDERLDPRATIPLCLRCHKAEHAAWRAVGLDSFDHPLLARTFRVTWTLGRLAALHHELQAVHRVLVVIRDDVAELVAR